MSLTEQVAEIQPGDWVRATFDEGEIPYQYVVEGYVHESGAMLCIGPLVLRFSNGKPQRWLTELEHRPRRTVAAPSAGRTPGAT